jgi:predicted enzyme related to lactoylglutathione lyase
MAEHGPGAYGGDPRSVDADSSRRTMATSLLAIVVDCRDSFSQANYWATALDHQVSERNANEYEVSDPSSGGTPLYFMNVPEAKTLKNRLHIDISTDGSIENAVARLVAGGGSLVEMRQDPATLANPDTWAVMQDPEGNEFCVLNADSVAGMA